MANPDLVTVENPHRFELLDALFSSSRTRISPVILIAQFTLPHCCCSAVILQSPTRSNPDLVAAIAVSSPKSTGFQSPISLRDSGSSFLGGSLKGFSLQLKTRRQRKDSNISLVVASASATTTTAGVDSGGFADKFYFNITGFPFPLGPFLNRRTARTEAVKGSIWLFEQEQALGFSSVSTNIRMTIVKLKSGGLWVHAPIAPTKECIELVKKLGAPVEYIVQPTFAYEHKIFVAPFSRKFPKAQVWVAPRQWSWPLNLPLAFFGIFRAKILKGEDLSTPWADEIEQKVLSLTEVGIRPYVEVAFYHKCSRTLLVTDAEILMSQKSRQSVSTKETS